MVRAMKKKLFIAFCLLCIIMVGLAVGAYAWLARYSQKESVIARMEKAWNCRAALSSSRLNLFSSPATIEFREVKLAQRDDEVGKPLDKRAALNQDDVLLSAASVVLEVSLQDLVKGTANIKKLHIKDLRLKNDVDEEGYGTLDEMFDSPEEYEEVAAEKEQASTQGASPGRRSLVGLTQVLQPARLNLFLASAEGAAAAPTDTTAQEVVTATETPRKPMRVRKNRKQKDVKKERKPFKAQDLFLAFKVDEASVTGAHLDFMDWGKGIHSVLNHVNVSLTNIDVNPKNLAEHNRCEFAFDGKISVEDTNKETQVANFETSGKGDLTPFDQATGEWKPDFNIAVLIKKSGLLGGALLSEQMDAKQLKNISEYGLEIGDLHIGGVLQEDATTEIHGIGSKLIVKKDTRLVFPQYEISMLESSWIDSGQDMQLTKNVLIASPELSKQILEDAEKYLEDKVGGTAAKLALGAVGGAGFVDEQNRVIIKFRSKGSLSKPDVKLDNPLNKVKDNLKDVGKSLLDSLLGQ